MARNQNPGSLLLTSKTAVLYRSFFFFMCFKGFQAPKLQHSSPVFIHQRTDCALESVLRLGDRFFSEGAGVHIFRMVPMTYICICIYIYVCVCAHMMYVCIYLRAAAPAADPGKEKPVMVSAGFVRVFCESSAWMLYIYIIYIYASNSIYLYVEVKFC